MSPSVADEAAARVVVAVLRAVKAGGSGANGVAAGTW